jgi:hypothetical protein
MPHAAAASALAPVPTLSVSMAAPAAALAPDGLPDIEDLIGCLDECVIAEYEDGAWEDGQPAPTKV